MSTYAITGNTGGGKSYMAAALIAAQLKAKRVVVTNIPMLIESPYLKDFSWDDIKDDSKPLIPGALYVIDEVWKEIPAGLTTDKVNLRIRHFFKEQRHYKDAKGRTIDVYLVTQNAGTDIASAIRSLIKQTFLCYEPMDLGIKDQRVRYYYAGAVTGVDPDDIRKKPIKTETFKLKPEVFELYKSHTQAESTDTGDVIEQTESATIFQGWRAKLWAFGVVSSLMLGAWAVHRSVTVIAPKYQKPAEQQLTGEPAKQAGPETGVIQVAQNVVMQQEQPKKAGESVQWRLVGDIQINGQHWAYMTDKTGRARRLPLDHCRDEWDTWICEYNGETVAMWTGPLPNDNSGQISTAVGNGVGAAKL